MQDKANGDSQENSVGEVNDQKVQQPQDGRKAAQKRTFTRWINTFLQRCDPPVEVHDLFTDIQDGRVLMALLEELSGCKLLYRFRSSSHRIFRLNNISKALAFLDDRHVRLLGIDAPGIADGVPSVVLNLVWNIILHFQVKEVTGGLQRHLSSSLSSSPVSSYPSSGDITPQTNDGGSCSCKTLPSKSRKATREPKYQGKAIKTLLQWVQRCTLKFGVEVHDFGKSWRSGLAFLAMIKSINPALVDLMEIQAREPRENIQLALNAAHHSLDIPPLLEPEDVLCKSPDEKSIITYVSMFLRHCTGTEEDQKSNTEIPHFGSLESVNFGEILADEPEAKALLAGLEGSSEQQLWKRWARRPSGSTRTNSLHKGGAASDYSPSCGDIFSSCHSQDITDQPAGSRATSAFTKKKGKCRSVFKSPSPLDAGVTSQEIRSWMQKASLSQSYSKPRVDESRFSLSSEEGIYSVLDSDEEEAYSYILELNEEDSRPYNQMKRQVPRVEEETAEEMFLNGQQTEESKHLEVCETSNENECKHQEGSHNVESEVVAQAGVHRKFERGIEDQSREGDKLVDKAEEDLTFEEMQDRTVGSEKEEDDSLKKDERRNQQSVMSVGSFTVEENEKLLFDEAVYEVRGADPTFNTEGKNDSEDNVSIMEDLTSEDEDEEDHSDEDTYWMDSEEVLTEEEKNREQTTTYKKATISDRPAKTTSKNGTNGGVKVHGDDNCWTPAGSTTCQSFRGGGVILQSLAACCDLTPLEVETLLVLWILLYCCLILPQLNL